MARANRVNTVSKQRVALFFCVRRILPALFFFGKVACGHSLFGRCLTITELMINEQIRDKEIRLIDENGEQHVYIEPLPYDGYVFDHWEISGGPFRTDSKYTDPNMNIIISGDLVCTPYYRKASSGGTTGPVATATAKKDDSTTSPKTGASDVVPYAILVLSLAACGAAVFKLVKSK